MTQRILPVLFAALVASTLPGVAHAGDDVFSGDGSATNNPDLLRGAYECGRACPPVAYPVDEVPSEDYDPLFDVDWSILLGGSYITQNGAGSFAGTVAPTVSLSTNGLRSSFSLDSSAVFELPQDSGFRIADLRLSAAYDYALDSVTNFGLTGDLDVSQARPGDPSNLAGTATSPIVVDGEATATISRDIDIADVELRGTLGRTTYGDTTLNTSTVIDNSASNVTSYGVGLRLGHRVTPVVAAFVDVSATHEAYDAVSPTLLVSLDSTDTVLRAGLSASRGERFDAEASVGVGLRRFADPSLPSVTATLYDLTVKYLPDETLTLTASLGSSIEGPGPTNTGTATITHTADVGAAYIVNSWWSLRGSAGWRRSEEVGSGDVKTGYSVGVGSDYKLSAHAALTADYGFDHVEGTAVTDTHTVTAGIRISR